METALRERLERARGRDRATRLDRRIARMQDEVRELQVVDARSADEIIGYDERGLPA